MNKAETCLGLKTTAKWASKSLLNLVLVSKFSPGEDLVSSQSQKSNITLVSPILRLN